MAIKIRANIKTKELTLPIGIIDPKTGEVHKRVTVAGMDGNMEEKVSEKKVRNNGAKIITALLAEKIIAIDNKSYPNGIGTFIAKNMWSGDRDKCLVEIRSLMADDMLIKPKCTECGETDEDVIYMSEIESGNWDESNPPDGVVYDDIGVLCFELPDGLIVEDDETHEELLCKSGKIRLTDGAMEEMIAGSARNNLGMANTSLLAACIVEIENIKIVDSYVIKAMSKRDRDYLSHLLTKSNPGPKFVRSRVCPNCGATYEYSLRLPDFFTFGTNQ